MNLRGIKIGIDIAMTTSNVWTIVANYYLRSDILDKDQMQALQKLSKEQGQNIAYVY